jgi:hypothetical protein
MSFGSPCAKRGDSCRVLFEPQHRRAPAFGAVCSALLGSAAWYSSLRTWLLCSEMARPDPSRGTSTAAGKCLLDMLGIFADFETNLRRERQLEGIAKTAGGLQGPQAKHQHGRGGAAKE